LLRRWAVFVPIAVLTVVVSFLPTAVLNIIYCRDWSGLSLEVAAMNMKHPFVGIWGNLFLLLLDNFVPTFFPPAVSWNESFFSFMPAVIADPLRENFDIGFEALYEMPSEDWAGLGFGLSVLILLSFRAARRIRRVNSAINQTPAKPSRPGLHIPSALRRLAIIAGWVALLVYCLKSGMATGARLVSPYYAFLIPIFLTAPELSQVIRQRWWRGMVWAVFLLAILVVILLPGHPLWPGQTLLTKANNYLTPPPQPTPRPPSPKPASTDASERIFETWAAAQPREPETAATAANASLFDFVQPEIERALNVYTVYGQRSDPLEVIRAHFPPGLRVIGFLGNPDDASISLWRPLAAAGLRRFYTVTLLPKSANETSNMWSPAKGALAKMPLVCPAGCIGWMPT